MGLGCCPTAASALASDFADYFAGSHRCPTRLETAVAAYPFAAVAGFVVVAADSCSDSSVLEAMEMEMERASEAAAAVFVASFSALRSSF